MTYIIWSIIFLGICSITDIRERKICVRFCIINIVFALLSHLYITQSDWSSIFMGMLLGGVFFVISAITKEAVGKGDALIILTLGSIEGVKGCFENLIWAFIFCTLTSFACIVWKKRKLSSTVPFAPYLFLGNVVTILL